MGKLQDILLLVSGLCLLSIMAGCQERTVKTSKPIQETPTAKAKVSEPEPIQSKAIIEVAHPIIDFGKLSPKDKEEGLFVFKNTGETTLQITRIKKTCGCTKAEIITKTATGQTKMNYEPGESGTIKVNYTATSSPGPTSQSVTIFSNATNKATFVCRFKAMIELAVNATPTKLTLLLKAENAGITPITLKSSDDQAFKIISFSSTKNAIQADFDPNETAKEFVLHPKVDVELLKDNTYGGVINIGLSHPKVKSIRVRYSYKPLWVTIPSRFLVRNIERGKVVQRDLFIKSNYGEKVEIDSVSSKKKLMNVISMKQDGNTVRMVVKITSSADTRAPWLRDTLEIRLKNGEILKVDCIIYFKKKPANNSK